MQLAVRDLDLGFKGRVVDMDQIKGTLKLASPDASMCLDRPYLENDTLNLNLPLQLNLSEKQLHLDASRLGMNHYLVNLEGDAERAGEKDVNLDVTLNTNALLVGDILKYLAVYSANSGSSSITRTLVCILTPLSVQICILPLALNRAILLSKIFSLFIQSETLFLKLSFYH